MTVIIELFKLMINIDYNIKSFHAEQIGWHIVKQVQELLFLLLKR